MRRFLKVVSPAGQTRTHALDSEIILGGGSQAQVRLPAQEGFQDAHLLLSPQESRCWVSASSKGPLVGEDGRQITGEFVPWNSSFTCNHWKFFLFAETGFSNEKKSGNEEAQALDKGDKSENEGKLRILMGIVLVAICMWGLGLGENSESGHDQSSGELGLFESPRGCTSENYLHRAQLAEASAKTHFENSVFDGGQWFRALQMMEESSDCYRLGGDEERGRITAAKAEQFRMDIQSEFSSLSLSLRRNMKLKRFDSALRQLRRLRSLLAHKQDSSFYKSLQTLEAKLVQRGEY